MYTRYEMDNASEENWSAGAQTEILSGTSFAPDPTYPAIPNLPVPISYPQTATSCMLPLDPARL